MTGPLAESLSRHLPQYAHNHIFGKGNLATPQSATETAENRPCKQISVYLVSTNVDQISYISRMWSSVPSRVIVLKGDDFFSKADGRYDTMGVDRLAVLRGAADLHGFPALVIDGGTATTYTAADAKGKIMGGGIGPGLQIKLRCMHEYTDALPLIGPQDALSRVKEATDRKKTLQIFSRDTKDAMMASVLGEYAANYNSIIQAWLHKVGPAKLSSTNQNNPKVENRKRAVMITGGDGEILSQLLQSNHGGIIESIPELNDTKAKSFEIIHNKQLIHYGISSAIMKQVELARKNSLGSPETSKDKRKSTTLSNRGATNPKKKRKVDAVSIDSMDPKSLLKKRIAKTFTGEVFFGEITKYEEEGSDSWWHVVYDDGDSEDLEKAEMEQCLALYTKKKKNDAKYSKDTDLFEVQKSPDKNDEDLTDVVI